LYIEKYCIFIGCPTRYIKLGAVDIYHMIKMIENVILPVLALFFLSYKGLPRSFHYAGR
jgi:hypothetical protein